MDIEAPKDNLIKLPTKINIDIIESHPISLSSCCQSENPLQSQHPKWKQQEIENQKSLIKFLMTPTSRRCPEEAKIQLDNIKDSM